jgi:tetratricopeptide (TPR) repeat protein
VVGRNTFPTEYLGQNYSELINALVVMKNSEKAKEFCLKSIEVEKNYIQSHKNEFLGQQYVRMANAYLTLKNTDQAIENFKKGADEFKREREIVNQKTTKTEADAQRIEILNRELQNLKQFKQTLLSKKNG